MRFRRPLEIGAAVQLEGLPAGTQVTARVVNCIPIGEYEKLWLLGLALDEPGNVWGVQTPPEIGSRIATRMGGFRKASEKLAKSNGI